MFASPNSLFAAYKDCFPIGTAIKNEYIINHEYKDVLLRNFNSITPENALKFEKIQPYEGIYDYKMADELVEFALSNQKLIRGHTLIWHEQIPKWVFSKGVSKEVMLLRMKKHIDNVVSRYKGMVYCWDVLNEAIDDGIGNTLRNSNWKVAIGDDYIDHAFVFAHNADPDALLYFNDYNLEEEEKGEKAFRFIKGMLERDIPIHGVGFQGHYSIYYPDVVMIERAIDKFSKLGLEIQITELDISLYDFSDHRNDIYQPNTHLIEQQAIVYDKLFEIFREYKDIIEGVTIWGISDAYTWRDNYPVSGRKDWPLIYNTDLSPKKAYYNITQFSKNE